MKAPRRHVAYARAVREVCDRWAADRKEIRRVEEGATATTATEERSGHRLEVGQGSAQDRRPTQDPIALDVTRVAYCGPVYSVGSDGRYRTVPR